MTSRSKLFLFLVCFWIDKIAANDQIDIDGKERNQNGQYIRKESGHSNRKSQPYQFEELDKKEANNDNGKANRRYIIQYKMGAAKNTGSGKVSSKWNSDLIESTKVLSLDKANADVVLLNSEEQLLQLEDDENVEYLEEG